MEEIKQAEVKMLRDEEWRDKTSRSKDVKR